MKKKLTIVCLFFMPVFVMAQSSADSLFRNYLYDTRSLYFRQLPIVKKAFVFWGDSMTHWGDWAELTGNAKSINRGIAGDNTYGLLHRLDDVVKDAPERLYILIGTNDINVHIPQKDIIRNYDQIIRQVKEKSPQTKMFVQSVFPINNDLIGRKYYTGTNEQIQLLNKSLDSLTAAHGVTFVNLYPYFLDDKKQLAAEYTSDGLHLTGVGYVRWVSYLRKHKLL